VTSDDEIERAFDDAIALAGVVDTFDAIQALAGDDVAGLGPSNMWDGAAGPRRRRNGYAAATTLNRGCPHA
jgi:hypothetical protein